MISPSISASPPPPFAVIPPEAYISPEYARLEEQHIWRRVWQPACREEEIPEVGDFLTYDIVDDSIIVARTAPDTISAYYNVCAHRGRRLTTGCGHAKRFHCKFHGWQWTLDGENIRIVDRDDWGDKLNDADVRLGAVHVGTWGGYVFISMDPDPVPLREFLEPAAGMLRPFEIENMRFRWHKSAVIACNWKVALEAFNEGYHVQTTHPQMLRWVDDRTSSAAYGEHSTFGYPDTQTFGSGSPRLKRRLTDTRENLAEYYREMRTQLNATMTETIVASAQLLPDLPPHISPEETLAALFTTAREEDVKRGVHWPDITPEHMVAAGTDWHLFPNMIIIQAPTNVLGYRARPNGRDPDSCIFEAYALEKFPDGQAPTVATEYGVDTTDEAFWGKILLQDFQNMAEVQKGMKVNGFKGARPNPRQEIPVLNFHATLNRYILAGARE